MTATNGTPKTKTRFLFFGARALGRDKLRRPPTTGRNGFSSIRCCGKQEKEIHLNPKRGRPNAGPKTGGGNTLNFQTRASLDGELGNGGSFEDRLKRAPRQETITSNRNRKAQVNLDRKLLVLILLPITMLMVLVAAQIIPQVGAAPLP